MVHTKNKCIESGQAMAYSTVRLGLTTLQKTSQWPDTTWHLRLPWYTHYPDQIYPTKIGLGPIFRDSRICEELGTGPSWCGLSIWNYGNVQVRSRSFHDIQDNFPSFGSGYFPSEIFLMYISTILTDSWVILIQFANSKYIIVSEMWIKPVIMV